MMASRGMGAMNPKKMPGKKTITRKDDPNKVAVYKDGGETKDEFKPYIQGEISSNKYGVGGGGRAGDRARTNRAVGALACGQQWTGGA